MLASSSDARYVDNGDGTVSDVTHGITWQKCTVGQTYDRESGLCEGAPSHFENWEDALSQVNGEFDLPNIKELASIVERSCIEPAIKLDVFPGTPLGIYWTNTPSTDPTDPVARVVDFTDGAELVRDANRGRYVRLLKKR